MYNPKLSENETKKLVREDIIKSLSSLISPINRILTLPCLNFNLELEAIKLGYKVNTVEKDKSIFYRQKIEFAGLPKEYLSFNNKTVSQFLIEHPTRKYDLVYLDFCGSISQEVYLSLVLLMGRCNIIYITVYLARENNIFSHLFNGNKIDDYECIFEILGFKVEKYFKYQNGKAPMVTFKLVKNNNIGKTKIINFKEKIVQKENKNMLKGFIDCSIINKEKISKNLGNINFNNYGSKLTINDFDTQNLFKKDTLYKIYYNDKTSEIALEENKELGNKFFNITITNKSRGLSVVKIKSLFNIKNQIVKIKEIKKVNKYIVISFSEKLKQNEKNIS